MAAAAVLAFPKTIKRAAVMSLIVHLFLQCNWQFMHADKTKIMHCLSFFVGVENVWLSISPSGAERIAPVQQAQQDRNRIHLFIHSFVYEFIFHSFIHSFIHSFSMQSCVGYQCMVPPAAGSGNYPNRIANHLLGSPLQRRSF